MDSIRLMETPQETLAKLPHAPGIYIYKDSFGHILYVGKAKDLKKRVSQYFQPDAAIGLSSGRQGDKTSALCAQIRSIKTIITDSEFDALLLESRLIREHLPKYNAISRDDKSPLYIAITTHESLPRIMWLRKTSLSLLPKARIFGPFQSGRIARMILRDLRRIIPYCTAKVRDGKPCFYTHLGLCGPCPSVVFRMEDSRIRQALIKQYRSNVKNIVSILSGKSLKLLHTWEKQMEKEAKSEQFEQAQRLKDTIDNLRALHERHVDPHVYIQNEAFVHNVRQEEAIQLHRALQDVYPRMRPIVRVECIDISHTYGTHSAGSLVVLIQGVPAAGEYRRFKIRTKDAPNDVAMIAEVLRRRLKHQEWPYPDLLAIDGGKGQVAAAAAILSEVEGSPTIPVIGLAKRFEEIIVPLYDGWKIIRLPVSNKGLHLLQRVRDESHRFALRYHRLLRRTAFLSRAGPKRSRSV